MNPTEKFIKKAKEIHGDKYDYSKVEYKTTRTRVIIICPKHGEFLQMPETHLKGVGCPKCNLYSEKNLKNFIEKSQAVHGDKYDYSKSVYKGSNQKIEIICPEHGSFWMRASAHYSQGQGCPKCGDKLTAEANKNTLEEFIEKSNKIHNNYYNYNETKYINLTSPVSIICPKHGLFRQAPRDHLQGCGCPKCGKIRAGFIADQESFITKAISIYGNKYNYSKVEYKNNNTKVCIICPKHGEFWTTPEYHISHGVECQECKKEQNLDKSYLAYEEVIDRCIDVHDGYYKYIYSKSFFKNTNSEIEIICPEHGIFKLKAIRHLNGTKCPHCTISSGELKTKQILTELSSKYNFDFIYQAREEFLRRMSYDFYIPDLEIAIEYQGKQHYEPIEYFGGEASFIKQQERDDLKRKLSKEYNINLIEIRYNHEEEDFKLMKDIIIEKIKEI